MRVWVALGLVLECLGIIFPIVLLSCRNHFGVALGSFWSHCQNILGSFGDRFGVAFEPFSHHCSNHFSNHFGIIFRFMLGSCWGHFPIIVGSCWGLLCNAV